MINNSFNVACFQLNSSSNVAQNILQINTLFKKIKKKKINLVCLPECAGIFSDSENLIRDFCIKKEKDNFLNFLKESARSYNFYIILGSMPVKANKKKFFNRSFVINNNGQIISFYDKINLFDVSLKDNECYQESKLYSAGKIIKTSNLPWGKIGLTICYDIRFPNLYRNLAKKKIKFFSIPAAFTKTTGKLHWHCLVKTRAIESGSYVFAAAQCGVHENGRETFGHSMIVNPWGEVLAEADENSVCFIASKIDANLVNEVRKRLPSTLKFN